MSQSPQYTNPNDKQVGGTHYKVGGEEHWDRAWRLGFDPFQYQITKYVERWKKKNGLQDLEKALHFLEKYIDLVKKIENSSGFIPLSERTYKCMQCGDLVYLNPGESPFEVHGNCPGPDYVNPDR